MSKSIYVAGLLCLWSYTSCSGVNSTNCQASAGWITQSLPNGWSICTPSSFRVVELQGIDSRPGYLSTKADSVRINFDSGHESLANDNCSFDKQVEDMTKEIRSGAYHKLYNVPEQHRIYLDTINGIPALKILPSSHAKGIIQISLHECKSGDWIYFSVDRFSSETFDGVVKMLRTLSHN